MYNLILLGVYIVCIDIFQNWQWSIPLNDPQRSMTDIAEWEKTLKGCSRSTRKCWFRVAGLKKSTKTKRSRAGKFTKLGFLCAVPMQNCCLWTSVYTIAHGLCVTLHQSKAFSSYTWRFLLWQSSMTSWHRFLSFSGLPLNRFFKQHR